MVASPAGLERCWPHAIARAMRHSLAEQAGEPALAGDWVSRELFAELANRWRSAHEDLVDAVEFIRRVESEPANQCERLLTRFSPRDVLLELLTYEYEDGFQLAVDFVDHVGRSDLQAALDELLDDASLEGTAAPLQRRVVIFGGHPRDESKAARNVAAEGGFELRWKPCDPSQGSPDARVLSEQVVGADGVLIVTSLVSHNVMNVVKRSAERHGVRWLCIEKATDQQLRRGLNDLFRESCNDDNSFSSL